MMSDHTEWWHAVDYDWDELVALLKGCTLADQQAGTASLRSGDARVIRRLVGRERHPFLQHRARLAGHLA